MDYYSVIKINEPLILAKTWRKLKCVMISEKGQFGKTVRF